MATAFFFRQRPTEWLLWVYEKATKYASRVKLNNTSLPLIIGSVILQRLEGG